MQLDMHVDGSPENLHACEICNPLDSRLQFSRSDKSPRPWLNFIYDIIRLVIMTIPSGVNSLLQLLLPPRP